MRLTPNPPTVDSDGDGITDLNEDPNRNGIVDLGETDPDNADSDSDGAEIALGLDPLKPDSFFQLTSSNQPDGNVVLQWPSKPGTKFRISASPDLSDWSETIVTDYPAAASGTSTTYDIGIPTQQHRFFRISFNP